MSGGSSYTGEWPRPIRHLTGGNQHADFGLRVALPGFALAILPAGLAEHLPVQSGYSIETSYACEEAFGSF